MVLILICIFTFDSLFVIYLSDTLWLPSPRRRRRRRQVHCIAYTYTCNIFTNMKRNRLLSYSISSRNQTIIRKQRVDKRKRGKREHQTMKTKEGETINSKGKQS